MRRALRSLAARPGFTATAVATLALGLGVNTAIFSLTHAMLLRPLPYRDADRLVQVYETNPSRGITNAPPVPVNYVTWRLRVDAFEQSAAFQRVAFNLSTANSAVQVEGFRVAPTFFPMLGIDPAIGRGFLDENAQKGRDTVVILSDGFWHRRFGADPRVVGQSIGVDGTPCTIVGVLPPTFKIFRVLNRELDVFRPFVIDPTDREHSLNLWAKLKPGVTVEQARVQLATVFATLPIPEAGWIAEVAQLSTRFAANSRDLLIVLESAVALVLLIACANVANLLLAVSVGRRKELAVRTALGASRWRIARDLAGESLWLASAGAVLGALIALWIVATFNAVISFQDINRLEPFRVDASVMAFTAGLAAIVAVAFALLPIRAAGDVNVVDALKESAHSLTPGGSARRLRHALIAGELALSIVLAASAAVLARSALALHGLARGVRVDGVMTAQISLSDPRFSDPARLVSLTTAIVDRLRTSTGIEQAALVNYAPLSLIRTGVPVDVEGNTPPPGGLLPVARYWAVGPEYFRLVGIPLVGGRYFTAADDATSAGVAIVSETFARRNWQDANAVGRRLQTKFPNSDAFWIPRARTGALTVVGIVPDVREDGLPDATSPAQLYLPYAQNPTPVVTLLARPSGGVAGAAAGAIRAAVHSIDPLLPVSYEMTFDDVVRETFARPREAAWLIGVFAALAVILAAVGVYGVMAYSTSARAKEIAIRMALGATRSNIVGLIVRQALMLTAIGVGIGVAATPLALRLASGLLFGVGPFDPWTLGGVAATLAIVSAGAAAIPAWRASLTELKP
jgi:putative ABC transport system permease protein